MINFGSKVSIAGCNTSKWIMQIDQKRLLQLDENAQICNMARSSIFLAPDLAGTFVNKFTNLMDWSLGSKINIKLPISPAFKERCSNLLQYCPVLIIT